MIDKEPKKDIKKIVLITLLCVSVLALIGATGWYFYNEAQYKTYFNEKQGFRIKYPKTWTISQKPIPGMIAGFVSPKENALDLFLENIAITTKDLSDKPLTLDEYVSEATKRMTAVFKNLKVEPPVDVNLSGHPGKRIIMKTAEPEASVVVAHIFVAYKRAYNITYMGTALRYPKDAPIIADMIRSLKVYF